MSQPVEQLADDLRFVRQTVESSNRIQYRSLAIPVLWAGVIAVGFALNDFWQSPAVGWYWMVVPALAGLLSGWLSTHAERSAGMQSDRQLGRRAALHFLTIFAGFIALAVIIASQGLDWRLGGQLMTLVFGIDSERLLNVARSAVLPERTGVQQAQQETPR